MTNRERINGMSNEELEELLGNIPCGYCPASDFCYSLFLKYPDCDEVIKEWLEQEVEE